MSLIGKRRLVHISIVIMVFLSWCAAFMRQSRRTAFLTKQLASLELSLENMRRTSKETARELEGIRQAFPHSKEQIRFLDQLQEQRCFVRLVSIEPMQTESYRHLMKVSRKVAIEADYLNMMRFLHQLEKTHRFVIENLLVQASEESSAHSAEFLLTTVQLEDLYGNAKSLNVNPRRKGKSSSISLPTSVQPVDAYHSLTLSTISRDPFKTKRRETVWARKSGSVDISAEYRVTGIINFPSKRLAVIESKDKTFVVGEGDLIEDKQVKAVEQDEILLISGEREYSLKIGPSGTVEED
jgi:hypothetical protein